MASLRGFDASKVKPFDGFDPIPAGIYRVAIIASEMKATKAGDGRVLELTFEVLDGEHQNSQVRAWLNLENPSEKAVQIGRGQLSAVCRAVNVLTPNDSVELHDIPLWIKVGVKLDSVNDRTVNEVKGFYGRDKVPGGVQETIIPDEAPF